MTTYFAILHKDRKSSVGVVFPDLPGCYSAGETYDEAYAQVEKFNAMRTDLGLPTSFNGAPAYVAFELLAREADAVAHIDQLHDELRHNDIWIWKKGAIEVYLGIEAKKATAHMAFLDRFKQADYRAAIPDYQLARDALSWLRI